MKRSFFCMLFVLSILLLKAQDSTKVLMSFDQAREISMRNSHEIKQIQYLQEEKNQEVKAARGYYLPKVGITATYMLMSDDLHLDLSEVKDAITPLYSALGHYGVFTGVPNPDPATNTAMPILPDNYSTQAVRTQLLGGLDQIEQASWDKTIQKKDFGLVAATAQWPIYVGGKIRAANAAANIESKEVSEQAKAKNCELITQLVERYYGLCLAQQAVVVRSDVYYGMQRHLDDATKMEKQGLIANADVLHARVYFAQAERELNKAKRTSEIINQALIATLAIDSSAKIQPVSELFYLDTIESLEYFIGQMHQNNSLLKQVESKKELTIQNYRAQRSDLLPEVALQGMYNIADKDLSPYAPDWMVGVGLKWTLFDGASMYRKLKAASYKTEQVEEFHQKTSADLETAVEKTYHELQMYHEQLVEINTEDSFAKEYLKVSEKAFYQDMSNTTEVIDARLALAKVSIEKLQAMYGYDLALAQLLQYSGISDKFNDYRTRTCVKTEKYKSILEK